MFRLTKIIRPGHPGIKRLLSTVGETAKKPVKNTDTCEKVCAVVLTAGAVGVAGAVGYDQYTEYRDKQRIKVKCEEAEQEGLENVERMKKLVASLRPITKGSLQKQTAARTAEFTAELKKQLYEIDIETVAVRAANKFDSGFNLHNPMECWYRNDGTDDDYVGLSKVERCQIFKSLLPEYHQHLKDSLGMNLDVTYEGGSNCWYRFKF